MSAFDFSGLKFCDRVHSGNLYGSISAIRIKQMWIGKRGKTE